MKLVLGLLFFFLSTGSFAQNSYGYFGKKNVLSADVTGCAPAVYWFTRKNHSSHNYRKSGSKLVDRNDLFDGGINLTYCHFFSGKFGLGMEYGLNFSSMAGPSTFYMTTAYGTGNEYGFEIRHEQLKLQSMTFLPKIEWSFLGEQFPIGISNQFGVGFTTTKVVKKDYLVEVVSVNGNENNLTLPNEYDPSKILNYENINSIKSITLLYAFNVTTPVARNLAINYGIRYTLNISPELFNDNPNEYYYGYGTSDEVEYFSESGSIRNNIRSRKLVSIIALNLGVSYIF